MLLVWLEQHQQIMSTSVIARHIQ